MKNIKCVLVLSALLLFFLGGIAFSDSENDKKAGKEDEAKTPKKSSGPEVLSDKDKAALEKMYKDRVKKEKKEYEGVPWSRAHEKSSAHYIVRCNSTKAVTNRYSKLMEVLFKKFTKVFGDFKPDNRKSQVEIYCSQKQFMQLPGMRPGIGGFYQPRSRVLKTYHGRFGSGDTSMILAHEGTHQFQHLIIKGSDRTFFSVPIWLLEGMAVLFEASEISLKGRGKVKLRGVNNDRLMHMQSMIRKGTNKPLIRIISTPQAQFKAEEYAHAGLLQFYMLLGKDSICKKLRKVYNEYLWEAIQSARKGQPIQPTRFSALVKKHTKKSLEDMEEKWKKFVMKQKCMTFGKVQGNTFISNDFHFKFSTPGAKYKIECKEKLNPGEVAFLERGKDDKVRISAYAFQLEGDKNLKKLIQESNESKQKNAAEIKKQRDAYYQEYKEEGEGPRKVKEYEAYEYLLKIKSDKSIVNKDMQKVHTVSVEAYGYLYRFTLQCPYNEYSKYKPEFEKMLLSFLPYAGKIK